MAAEEVTARVREALRRATTDTGAAADRPYPPEGTGAAGAFGRLKAAFGRERRSGEDCPDRSPSVPKAPRDLIGEDLIEAVSVSPSGVAKVVLRTKGMGPDAASDLARLVEFTVAQTPGVVRAVVVGGADGAPRTAATQRGAKAGGHEDPLGIAGAKSARIDSGAEALSHVACVVAIASGKGGVGKSTVALYLALALKERGLKVGLLDADIYGPSLPTLVGWRAGAKPDLVDGRIAPVEAFGLETMSIGFLVDEGKALAWRGPMVMGATRQLVQDVAWGKLDVLVIDTPPGTGDVHLTLARTRRGARALIDGAIVVTTPQPLARADVARGLQFFAAVGVPVVGQVRNMAFMTTPDGARFFPFGKAGAAAAGEPPVIVDLPLAPALATLGATPPDFATLPAALRDEFLKLADAALRAVGNRQAATGA